ncbi:MAG: methyltransferase domain-containing protein [Rhodothermales bacterium]|nr:methyltransferase domain-containing protein [Rhodothermales bacterium]
MEKTAVDLTERISETGVSCRFCGLPLSHSFADLGTTPLCESYLEADALNRMEPFYPLHAFVCEGCLLVQLDDYVGPEHIFTEYAYFSSYADSWLAHARKYVTAMQSERGIDTDSFVIELASNDGYLLQYFVEDEIPCLGIEPAANVAEVAVDKGVPTRVEFFNEDTAQVLAREGMKADLVLGNNVLAQVPNLNSFVRGMKIILKDDGFITMEFPHLMRLMDENQFDTIYHEHFGYFSLLATKNIFAAHGLRLFDVEELSTHGGSVRIYACHNEDSRPETRRLSELIELELNRGFDRMETYAGFAEQVRETKRKLLSFLIAARREGKSIVGYGAPGKGNTLLNYCGIGRDFIDYTVDRNPYKQGMYLPGSRIPIYDPDRIRETRPDYVLILPWNFKDEIMDQMQDIRSWGGKFVVPIPETRVFE